MKKLLLPAALLLAAPLLTTGCLSFQTYGTPVNGYRVTEGASRADVLANLGEPDSIYKSADSEVFIYKGYKGQSWFGVYNKLERTDKVVVMDPGGIVLTTLDRLVGTGVSILRAPVLDATYPVPASELMEGPENYQYDFSVQTGTE